MKSTRCGETRWPLDPSMFPAVDPKHLVRHLKAHYDEIDSLTAEREAAPPLGSERMEALELAVKFMRRLYDYNTNRSINLLPKWIEDDLTRALTTLDKTPALSPSPAQDENSTQPPKEK